MPDRSPAQVHLSLLIAYKGPAMVGLQGCRSHTGISASLSTSPTHAPPIQHVLRASVNLLWLPGAQAGV